MDSKERQMVALGAKLVVQQEVQRTATEADQESTSEGSVLSRIAGNVSDGFTWALTICGQFAKITQTETVGDDGQPANTIDYKLNTNFDLVSLTPQERQETIAEWNAGAISWTEMRAALKSAGVASQADDVAKQEIQKDQAEALAAMPNPLALDPATGKPVVDPTNPAANPKTPPKPEPKVSA